VKTLKREERSLLLGVRNNLDDNNPRLVYADWLEENGEPERAEFIRVQCELSTIAAVQNRCKCDFEEPEPGRRCSAKGTGYVCELRRREFDSSRGMMGYWSWPFDDTLTVCLDLSDFNRGFVQRISGMFPFIQDSLSYILQRHPVVRVRPLDRYPFHNGNCFAWYRASRTSETSHGPGPAREASLKGCWAFKGLRYKVFTCESDAFSAISNAMLNTARKDNGKRAIF
jgi:uncharacterized protein (TIGR02996 family)